MLIFTIICCLGIGFSVQMLARNNWVHAQRLRILQDDLERGKAAIARKEYPVDVNDYFPTYNRLPSYDYMMWTFWIWDINKYLK